MFDRELEAALTWVHATDAIARHYEGSASTLKADGTPVTDGDRAVEAALRGAISTAFPGDAIWGEEDGETGDADRRWIIDPIDGTKNYLAEIPVYATLLAFQTGGVTQVALVSAPALEARWWAIRGGGAFRDGEPIDVSDAEDLGSARLCLGEISADIDGVAALVRAAGRPRGYADFWGFCLLAEGVMDVMYEPADLAPWDIAAPRLIVEEAGGRVTASDGAPEPSRGAILATNGRLHEAALKVLAAAR